MSDALEQCDPFQRRGKTNTEMVNDYMSFGSPLKQAFVVEAISRYAKECVEHEQELIDGMRHSFVSPDAWLACAKEWQSILSHDPRIPRKKT